MAGQKWRTSKKFPGVRWYEHSTRCFGPHRDRYFVLRYQFGGQRREEGLGWSTEGWTESKAGLELERLKAAYKTGEGLISLREKREQAQARREEAEQERIAEKKLRITLQEYWDTHYSHQARLTKNESSWSKEVQHLRTWIAPLMGDTPLIEIGFNQWDQLTRSLSAVGRSQRTREYVAGTLRRVLKHARDRGLPVDIPSARQIGATAPRDNRRQRVVTPQEAEQILNVLKTRDPCAWRVTLMAMLTGCRASELLTLTWAQVDLNAGRIHLSKTKNKDARTVPLSPTLLRMLHDIPQKSPIDPVFLNTKGQPYTAVPTSFTKTVAALGLNTGRTRLDRLSFHSFRHTAATNMANHVDIRTLMDTMGWRVVAMAVRYVHADEKAKRSALLSLDQFMTQQKGKVVEFLKVAQGG